MIVTQGDGSTLDLCCGFPCGACYLLCSRFQPATPWTQISGQQPSRAPIGRSTDGDTISSQPDVLIARRRYTADAGTMRGVLENANLASAQPLA